MIGERGWGGGWDESLLLALIIRTKGGPVGEIHMFPVVIRYYTLSEAKWLDLLVVVVLSWWWKKICVFLRIQIDTSEHKSEWSMMS